MYRPTVVTAAAIALAAGVPAGGQENADSPGLPRVAVGPNLRVSANTTSGSRNECWLTANATKTGFLVAVSQSSADNAGSPPAGIRSVRTVAPARAVDSRRKDGPDTQARSLRSST
jgi:hypothetical protein